MAGKATLFKGKSKMDIALEAFQKFGVDATKKQVDEHFHTYDIQEGCEPSMYYNAKRLANGKPAYRPTKANETPLEGPIAERIARLFQEHPQESDDQILSCLGEELNLRNVRAYRKIVEDQRRKIIMSAGSPPQPKPEKERPDPIEQIRNVHAVCSNTPGGIQAVRNILTAVRTMGVREFDNALTLLESIQLDGRQQTTKNSPGS